MEQTSHFNESANQWDTPEKIETAEKYGRLIKKRVKLGRSPRVLDFGCGTGLLSFQFASGAAEILGVDTSTGMLAVFESKATRFPQAHSLLVDLETSELATQSKFDLIVSSMAFHHLKDPSQVLAKLKSVLADNGKIAVIDLDEEDGTFHPDPAKMGVKHFGFSEEKVRAWAAHSGLKFVSREIAHTNEKEGRSYPIFLAIFSG